MGVAQGREEEIGNELPKGYQPALARARRELTYIWSAFEQAEYHIVRQTLPDLLLDAQRTAVVSGGDEAKAILTEVYQITASTLRKLGEYDLAWLAGDRGYALAEQNGDSVLSALIGFRVATALTALGRSKAAFDLNISLATRVEIRLQTDADRSVAGQRLLQAAMAAANEGDASGV